MPKSGGFVLFVRGGEQVPLTPVYTLAFRPVIILQALAEKAPHLQVRMDARHQHDQHPYEQAPERHIGQRNALEGEDPQVKCDPFRAIPASEQYHEEENHQDDHGPGETTHLVATRVAASLSFPENVTPEVPVNSTGTYSPSLFSS